jgi:2-oxoglutarate ferredoxin oxidoreductase subunit alpha
MRTDLIIGMAGAGGDGIVSAGESLMTAAALEGYHARMTKSFGSQIRGGESSVRLRLSTRPVLSAGGALDVAVALNWEDFLKFGSELAVSGRTVVIYDSRTGVAPANVPLPGVKPAALIAVPIDLMARETVGHERAKNTVVLGLLAGWFGLPIDSIRAGLRKKFQAKGADVLARNEQAFAAGLEYAFAHAIPGVEPLAPSDGNGEPRYVADGNEMCAAGAVAAGCQFFGGYPITPSSEIMGFLSREIWKYGGTLLQAEDEIAAIGAVVGASFAGRKAMTATSGPGMSLKTEVLGLATIAELPLVCVNVQRGGPSTGIPTKAEQSDLMQAIFASHGDVVRPVLAATTVADIFPLTVEAFNIAETYQTPVILLSDGDIGQRKETFDPVDVASLPIANRQRPSEADLAEYMRFRITETGVSPISEPGMERGNYLASGIEHTEDGAPTASGAVHARMTAKRIRKLEPLARRRDLFVETGPADAPLALVSWGSTAGVAMEALALASREGLRVKLLIPKLLYPVAEQTYREFFRSVRRGLVVEQSYQGQLLQVLRMHDVVPSGVSAFARVGAVPITPDDIVARLREMAVDLHTGVIPQAACD